jgi:protoheme IX farnesyltransferase
MLPVVAPAIEVSRRILCYAWATLICSLLLVPLGGAGPVYAVCALGAGGWLVAEAHLLLRRARAGARKLAPMRLFHLSITYLTVLFLAVAVDPFVRF